MPVDTATSTDSAAGSAGKSTTGTSTTPPVSTVAEVLALQGTPATTVVAGAPYYFQPTVTQSTDVVTFAITNQPGWATFSTGIGALYGTPPLASLGTSANISITATAGASTATIGPFAITVTAPAASPPTPPAPPNPVGTATLTWVAPTLNTDGSALTDLAGYHIYYGASTQQLSQEIVLNAPATTTYVVSGLTTGTYDFTVTAVNSRGTESAQSNVASKTI